MKKITTEIKEFQYFYPYTVALVGAHSESGLNFMACAWHTALSFQPPLFGVLISKKRFTHKLISEAKEFTVNFVSYGRVKLSAQFGRKSGYDVDKLKEFPLRLIPSKIIKSPLIDEAYAAFECRVADIKAYGDHDLFVGEVLAVHEEECFNEKGVLDSRKILPLLYLGKDLYITVNPDTLKHVLPD
ncbi:MAG: flavin reductase family protein [Candidatus Aminicenantales bacterium]